MRLLLPYFGIGLCASLSAWLSVMLLYDAGTAPRLAAETVHTCRFRAAPANPARSRIRCRRRTPALHPDFETNGPLIFKLARACPISALKGKPGVCSA